ncbi:Tnks [Symbiodinium natans]|uniref:Poly [ADP-ribose] polymerase n=1 Tax=Symbiodinium natans TaxID=878477 RepID=A0A812TH07_9DINO|nr:Tnks [Symbiodinium natans]
MPGTALLSKLLLPATSFEALTPPRPPTKVRVLSPELRDALQAKALAMERAKRRRRLQAEAEVCSLESLETAKDDIEEQTLKEDVASGKKDVPAELQDELRQALAEVRMLSQRNEGLLSQLNQMRSSNTGLKKKLADKTQMLQKEQEFIGSLVDGLGTWSCSEASGRDKTVACWEYLEQEPGSWRRYLPHAEKSLEEAHGSKLSELILRTSGFDYRINLSVMTQTNVETRKTRAIRRREILLHADAVQKMTAEIQDLRGENGQLSVEIIKKAEEVIWFEEEIRVLKADNQNKAQAILDLEEEIACHKRTIDEMEEAHAEQSASWEATLHTLEKLQSALKQERQRHYTAILSQLPPKLLDDSPKSFCRSLDVDDPKHVALLEQFHASIVTHRLRMDSNVWCDPARVSVTRIEEVLQPANQLLYEAARRMRASEDSRGCSPIAGISAFKCEAQAGWVDMNEYLLYHGTCWHNAEQIIARGFDAQRGGESAGAMFGRGVYFAQNASKSDLYTTCHMCERARNEDFRRCRHPEGERCILVSRVLLGDSKVVRNSSDVGGKDQIRAPQRDDGTAHDSVAVSTKAEGGLLDHKEFVVFKDPQVLVRFRIFYQHNSDCSCNGCLHRRVHGNIPLLNGPEEAMLEEAEDLENGGAGLGPSGGPGQCGQFVFWCLDMRHVVVTVAIMQASL